MWFKPQWVSCIKHMKKQDLKFHKQDSKFELNNWVWLKIGRDVTSLFSPSLTHYVQSAALDRDEQTAYWPRTLKAALQQCLLTSTTITSWLINTSSPKCLQRKLLIWAQALTSATNTQDKYISPISNCSATSGRHAYCVPRFNTNN